MPIQFHGEIARESKIMSSEAERLKEDIEALKSLHAAWTTLTRLKAVCETRTWPFFDSTYSPVIYDDERYNPFLIE